MKALSVSPELFGRNTELAELQHWLEALCSGRGGVVLVAGKAGVGKSRLLSEALQMPEARQCAQIRVNCLEGDEAEPYSLMRSLISAAKGSPAEVAIDPAPEAERQVRQVQGALLALLEEVRGDRPLLVSAEDVHWSDSPSLQVLLALSLHPGPFLFLLSYRPEPITPGLASFLAEVRRLRLGETISLQPLSHADTGRMVRAMLDPHGTLPAGLLYEIMTVTEGIPFLVEELIHTLVKRGDLKPDDSGWRFRRGTALAVPGSLRLAIEGRLLLQPPEVIAVAEQAAVVGQVVDISRLERLSDLDQPELFTALHALNEAQILFEQPDGTITFRHALTREAIRTRLLQAERQALHQRMAMMLEEEDGASPSFLAYHWSEAGEVSRAASYAYQAAKQAALIHAHREAITHYELALSGGAGTREEILTALGAQHQALGELEEAVDHYREAQALYREAGDTTAVAILDLHIGVAYGDQRFRKEALESLQAAFTDLPTNHPERWRAGLYLGLQQAAMGSQEEAEATFLAAQEVARGTTVARLRIAYELSGLRARRGDWAALEEAGQQVLQEAPDQTDEGLAIRHDAHAALGSVAYYRGALSATRDHFMACLGIAKQRGLVTDQALARWNLATNALYHLGRWHEAREHLAKLQALSAEGIVEGAILFELWLNGEWEKAAEMWLESWPELEDSDDLEVQMAFGRRIADLLLALGRHQEALTFLDPLLARLRQFEVRSYELQLVPRQVEALARLGKAQALPVAKDGLELAWTLGGRPVEGLLLRGRALAHQEDGQWLDAFADFEEAIAILEELPMPYEVARTQREAGMARLARGRRGDRQRGAEFLRHARQQFADLGASRDENATDAILSAAGLADERERGPGPLTARELEVAELVTQGLSNAEIAERLFITEKTAAYHVGSILTKLDFNSRVQIAVYMTRQS